MDSRDEQLLLLRAEGGQPTRSGSGLLLLLPPESTGSSTGSSPAREQSSTQGKLVKPSPFSRERAKLLMMEEQQEHEGEEQEEEEKEEASERRNVRAAEAPGQRDRRDGSSSDTESDFYEEIDVSCTPESMDYPAGRGREP